MLEDYFKPYRDSTIGVNQKFQSPYGEKKIIYADWTASGRMHQTVEDFLQEKIYPLVANTHTETNITGSSMTVAYHDALQIIKKHVGANENDVIISSNSGMTGVINKFQRILGLKIHEKYKELIEVVEDEKPVVFVTHMEHHSNQTSWLETLADVVIVDPNEKGLVDLEKFNAKVAEYSSRKTKIAAVTSCSNVTGILVPVHEIAKIMHSHDGLCFVDFACSAPYININMHPKDSAEKLDGITFSPHKFLGGPGSTGILIFDKSLYHNTVPDNPGGGTVDWTNPWGRHKYLDNIEAREDGGTPAFLQTIRSALSILLKEKMGVDNILKREKHLLKIIWERLSKIENLNILAPQTPDRLGVISFYINDLHYNLGVRLLNDRFGIQMRGGCSCAGTYGHYLLNVDEETSSSITCAINEGDLSKKPGWIRLSIHPIMTDKEIVYILDSIEALASNFKTWSEDYTYNNQTNEFNYNKANLLEQQHREIKAWFDSF